MYHITIDRWSSLLWYLSTLQRVLNYSYFISWNGVINWLFVNTYYVFSYNWCWYLNISKGISWKLLRATNYLTTLYPVTFTELWDLFEFTEDRKHTLFCSIFAHLYALSFKLLDLSQPKNSPKIEEKGKEWPWKIVALLDSKRKSVGIYLPII